MRRLFSLGQRTILAFLAAGRCKRCRAPIVAFHADHVIPWSKGGPTITSNGEALCARCNLSKGASIVSFKDFEPREWQERCFRKAIDWLVTTALDRHFLINATPGAGKTLAACWIAKELIDRGLIERVVVIAPRTEVVRAWAADFKHLTGRRMMKITSRGKHLADFQPDICATWSAIADLRPAMQAICAEAKTLVICDEHHHAALAAAWGGGAEAAFEQARYVICLTGTPLRSDERGMVWFDLTPNGELAVKNEAAFTLTYKEAVEAGFCRPMTFHRHPGHFAVSLPSGESFTVVSGEPTVSDIGGFIGGLVERDCQFGKMIRVPYVDADGVPKTPSYHESMLVHANQKLDEMRKLDRAYGGLAEAGGMVVCPNIEMADYFADLIKLVEGKRPIVVHHKIMGTEQLIDAYRTGNHRWIVSVNMISEGVDIPRIRVIINLSYAETELYFRQLAGRAIRSMGDDDYSRAYMIIPELQAFTDCARNYEEEQGALPALPKPPPPPPPPPPPGPWVCTWCDLENVASATHCLGCGEVRFLPPPPPPPPPPRGTWTCDECGALNDSRTKNCHSCGAGPLIPPPPPPPPPPPVFTYTIDQAMGKRDGVIARGLELSEELTLRGESIAEMLIEFDLLVSPGAAKLFFRTLVPEQLAVLKDFAEWYPGHAQRRSSGEPST